MKKVMCSDWSSQGSYQWQIFFGFGGVNTWTQSSVMYWLVLSINCNSTKQLGYMKWKNYLGTLVWCLRGRCGYATMQIDWHTHCLAVATSLWSFITEKSGNCPLAAHTVLWVLSTGRSHCTLAEAEEEVLPPHSLGESPTAVCHSLLNNFC